MSTPAVAVSVPMWHQYLKQQTPAGLGGKNVGLATLRKWAKRPDFPAPIDPESHPLRYSLPAITAWLEQKAAA